MKQNKLRTVGRTIIIGALALGALFMIAFIVKMLLIALVVGVVVKTAARYFFRRSYQGQGNMPAMHGQHEHHRMGITPVYNMKLTSSQSTIIPLA